MSKLIFRLYCTVLLQLMLSCLDALANKVINRSTKQNIQMCSAGTDGKCFSIWPLRQN